MLSPEDISTFMEEAYVLAESAGAKDEVPVGAILVSNGKILSRGSNRREEQKRATGHAEIIALEEYSSGQKQWRLPPETSLFVTVEPCLMCTGALIWARLSHLYYGCTDPRNAGLTRVIPLIEAGVFDHKFASVQGGVLAEKCGNLMTGFFRKKRGKE
jgi:tRNA(adenine34) deaminase